MPGQVRHDGKVFSVQVGSHSTSKSIVPLLPSACRATALSAAHRLVTIDLDIESGAAMFSESA